MTNFLAKSKHKYIPEDILDKCSSIITKCPNRNTKIKIFVLQYRMINIALGNRGRKSGVAPKLEWIRENVGNHKHKEVAESMILDLLNQEKYIFLILNDDELSPAICRKAVELDEDFFEIVPEVFRTDEMLRIKETKMLGNLPFNELPDHLKTVEMCLQQVKENHKNIKYVPDDLKTPEMLKIAFEGMKK